METGFLLLLFSLLFQNISGCTTNADCTDGLKCIIPRSQGSTTGTCLKFCGGIGNIQCPSGATCVLDGTFPDAGGHCDYGSSSPSSQNSAANNGTTGAANATASPAAKNATTPANVTTTPSPKRRKPKTPTTAPPAAPPTGRPVFRGAGEGQQCAGFAGIPCAPGLTCQIKDNFADASGTCVSRSPFSSLPPCGGKSGNECAEGYVCVPGGPGFLSRCHVKPVQKPRPPTANPDPPIVMSCGGLARTGCPEGMTCELKDKSANALGKCVPQFCGGIGGIPCPDGFDCKLDSTFIADAGGQCVPSPSPIGQICGGTKGTPCPKHYICKLEANSSSGKCVSDSCGGFAGFHCPSGFYCKPDLTMIDGPGVCISEFCGGIGGIQCEPGFTCKLDGPFPDAGGKCVWGKSE